MVKKPKVVQTPETYTYIYDIIQTNSNKVQKPRWQQTSWKSQHYLKNNNNGFRSPDKTTTCATMVKIQSSGSNGYKM